MSDAAFHQEILDSGQMVSLLLVFLSVLFGLKFTPVTQLMGEAVPDAVRRDERTALRQRIREAYVSHLLPIFAPALIMALLLAPSTIRIIAGAHFSLAHYDLTEVLFVLVELAIVATLAWCIVAAVLLKAKADQAL
jgi:hypothetical protein